MTPGQRQDAVLLASRTLRRYPPETLAQIDDLVRTHVPSSFEMVLQTSDLAKVASVMNATVVSFQAAAIVVSYNGLRDKGSSARWLEEQVTEAGFADRDLINFVIDDVSHGSVRLKFSVHPRTPEGRQRLGLILAVGTAIVGVLVPPIAVYTTFVGVLPSLVEILTPDEPGDANAPSGTKFVTVDVEQARDVSGTLSSRSHNGAAAPSVNPPATTGPQLSAEITELVEQLVESRMEEKLKAMASALPG